MSVYARFKQDHEGFRKFVELLEGMPASRREKMIEVGMKEDPGYTQRALLYVFDFNDIIQLPDAELAEVCAKTPPKILAYAIGKLDDETKMRFLRGCKPKDIAEIRDQMEVPVGLVEVGGAQLGVIKVARALERRGFVQTKKIPQS